MKELKREVASLEPGQFLAIHGMPGSGKTVLAAEVVHDPEITLTVRMGPIS
jgi:KaiC/GvpD/RAD55 family RecA-like ATPase